MAQLRFYKNKYKYPHYSNSITAYGNSIDCTPIGMNFRGGTLRVKGNMTDFMSCNYLTFTRDNQTLYAWIEDVRFRTEDSFEVTYKVDAWRTYKSKINLGKQFVARQPGSTTLKDTLLGGPTDYPEVASYTFTIGDASKRYFVVQVRTGAGEMYSRTPVNPTPYQFFVVEYVVNNWTASTPLMQLMTQITDGAEPINIVTMYSIPYIDISNLVPRALPVTTASGTQEVLGFKILNAVDPSTLLRIETPIWKDPDKINELLRVDHSIQLVIPEAGIINIPDELYVRNDLKLRQDIDLFSGACNYMLMTGDGNYYTSSIRGSSISSIPIVSDPMDTYLSQNQNALATSLIGDVASIAIGASAAAATGGIGAAIGGSAVMSGVSNIAARNAGIKDAGNRFSNPPAFLGTALVSNFNQRFWLVISQTGVSNAVDVHSEFGYPVNLVKSLAFPSVGFIQTEGCTVSSTDGTVPAWALDEINSNFNNGILVRTT